MDKRIKIYIVIFIVIVGLLIYADATKPKPISWFPSYTAQDKIPYGMFILRNQLKNIFPESDIKDVKVSPYVFLQDSTVTGTYFFVNGLVNFGEDEFNELLKFVHRGNDVFIATNGANIDTLHLKTENLEVTDFKENYQFSLLNKNLSTEKISFDRPSAHIYFTEIDTLKSTALGKVFANNNQGKIISEGVNFLKYKVGKGNFFFHTFPLAFTNYAILKDNNSAYVSSVLSYLDQNKPILYDEYYKTGKKKITSPFHYILSSPNLKWAYYMAIIGLVIFVIFKGKREQRHIPLVTPLKNQTLAFTRTIANMYFKKQDHITIAKHKINYFLNYIRTKLHVSTTTIDDNFYNIVASRSNNPKENVIKLFHKIKNIQQRTSISKEELISLNEIMEDFKNSISKK